MANETTRNGTPRELPVIDRLTVSGFKSIATETSIDLKPLTILAGANSSGKSSMVQPLLLLKQTLEAPYDPGPLLLNGPNVKFTSVAQLSSISAKAHLGTFSFGIHGGEKGSILLTFQRGDGAPIQLQSLTRSLGINRDTFKEGKNSIIGTAFDNPNFIRTWSIDRKLATIDCTRERFLLSGTVGGLNNDVDSVILTFGLSWINDVIGRFLHVPALRGNPQRNYPLIPIGERYPGRFDDYVASIIAARSQQGGWLTQLGKDMIDLGLTWKITAKAVDDTQVELLVGRLPRSARGGAHDLVSIADVGFGVSQTLPVVVALLAAKPGQLVYIEQPEIHLHPRAQHAMAKLLARAAQRGVRLIIETHSNILLLGVQTLVAEGTLDPALVKLHWFERDADTGATSITSADLDATGAFGDWPVDFADVTMNAQMAYLNAAEAKLVP